MITITSPDHIKKFGEFKLDKVWVKSLKFENVAQNSGKKIIVVEVVPYAELEDGTALFDHDNTKKILISDAQAYLAGGTNPDFTQAYFGVENGIASMIQQQLGWECQFELG